MDWTNILEGVISGVAATLISMFLTWIFTKLIFPKLKKGQKMDTKCILSIKFYCFSPFIISLFLTSFFVVLTFFSLVYSWTTFNYVYLLLASAVLGFITYSIYNNQCPNCYRIFQKKLIKKDTMKEEKRSYHYRDCTIYLYTNGSEKDRKYHGKEKIKMETWRTEREFYECQSCGHKWDKIFERNLDINNRPKPNIIRTRFNPPNHFEY